MNAATRRNLRWLFCVSTVFAFLQLVMPATVEARRMPPQCEDECQTTDDSCGDECYIGYYYATTCGDYVNDFESGCCDTEGCPHGGGTVCNTVWVDHEYVGVWTQDVYYGDPAVFDHCEGAHVYKNTFVNNCSGEWSSCDTSYVYFQGYPPNFGPGDCATGLPSLKNDFSCPW